MSDNSPIPAVIDREDATAKYAVDESGHTTILVKGGINGTPANVGARGHLRWGSNASWRLQFFEAAS